jgi:hypothetical protein
VVWSSTTEPEINVSLDPSGQLRVDGSAELAVRYVESSDFGAQQQNETVTADLSGTVSYDGKTASVTFDQANGVQGD